MHFDASSLSAAGWPHHRPKCQDKGSLGCTAVGPVLCLVLPRKLSRQARNMRRTEYLGKVSMLFALRRAACLVCLEAVKHWHPAN